MAEVTDDARWLADGLARDGVALVAYCRRLAPDAAAADDLLQDTLLRALTHPPQDLERPLLPWLKTVARHLAVDTWRTRRDVVRDVEAAEPADPSLGPDGQAAVQEQLQAALVEAVAQLGVSQLAVFLLQAMLGLPADQVAEAVGKSPENVRVLTHRARHSVAAGGALSARVRNEAVAEFLERVCSARVEGLHDLIRLARPDGRAPDGELRVALRSLAASRAWERLVSACGAVLHREDHDAAPVALWCRAVALDEQGDGGGALAVMQQAVSASRARGLDGLTARALLGVAQISVRRGDMATFDEARRGVTEDGEDVDPTGLSRGTLDGARLWRRGELDGAAALYTRLLDSEPDRDDRAALLHNLALVEAYSGALQEARRNGEAALALHRAAGDVRREGNTLNALGMVAQNLGALAEAEGRFQEALRVLAPTGMSHASVGARTNLGLIAHERGDLPAAIAMFQGSATRAATAGLVRSEVIALANLGVAHHAAGRLRPAAAALDRASARLDAMDQPHLAAFVRAHRAAVGAWDDPEAALEDLQASAEAFEALGDARMAALVALLAAWVRSLASGDLDELQQKLDAVRRPGPDGAPPLIRQSVAVRIGAELVRRNVLRSAADTPSRPGASRHTS